MPSSDLYRNSISKEVLKRKSIKIFDGNKQILQMPEHYNSDSFDFSEFTPFFYASEFPVTDEKVEITNYRYLKELGFAIKRDSKRTMFVADRKFKQNPPTITIEPESPDVYASMPPNCKVIYDPPNLAAKVIVMDGKGREQYSSPWVSKRSFRESGKKDWLDIMSDVKQIDTSHLKGKRKVFVQEAILGISWETRKVICLPNNLIDMPRLGYIGNTGAGKTLGLHGLMDQLFWRFTDNCLAYYNDVKYENTSYVQKNMSKYLMKPLEMLHMPSRALPMVYLSPSVNVKKKVTFGIEEGIHFDFSLSWKSLIKRYNQVMEGHKELKLGKTWKRLDVEALKQCKNRKDVEEVLNELEAVSKGMHEKAVSTFSLFLDNHLVDIASENAPSELIVRKYVEDKVIEEVILPTPLALMYAGLIPNIFSKSLETIQLGDNDFKNSYNMLLMKELYDVKNEEHYFDDKKIWMFVDEIGEMIRKKASGPILEIMTLGRSENIGVIYANQNYVELQSAKLEKNTDYMLAFYLSSEDDRSAVCRDFQAIDYIREDLARLGSKGRDFECYLFFKKPIIVYDMDSGKKEELKSGAIKMQAWGPMSMHKKPSDKLGGNEDE